MIMRRSQEVGASPVDTCARSTRYSRTTMENILDKFPLGPAPLRGVVLSNRVRSERERANVRAGERASEIDRQMFRQEVLSSACLALNRTYPVCP